MTNGTFTGATMTNQPRVGIPVNIGQERILEQGEVRFLA